MPDDSTCFPKFGMFNEITEQFVSNRDDKEGLRLDGDWIDTGLFGIKFKFGLAWFSSTSHALHVLAA